MVNAVGIAVYLDAVFFAEMGFQDTRVTGCGISNGVKTNPCHLVCCGFSYKKQIAQRERPHFRGNILGEERMGFIGLFEIRSHFGQQLVTGNSDIDGEFQLFSDPFPDLVRYFVWPAKQVNGFCHVQKGLIDAEFLNIRGIFGKQVQHLSGITGVNIKAGGHDDEFRTLAQG